MNNNKKEKVDEIITRIGRKYKAICAFKLEKELGGSKVLQIAFLMGEKREEGDFHKIFSELSEELEMSNIDLVILNDAPLAIAYTIIKDGEEIYCDNREALKKFKANVTERYLDFRNEVRGQIEISLKKSGLS